jgi:hypothetical protein
VAGAVIFGGLAVLVGRRRSRKADIAST